MSGIAPQPIYIAGPTAVGKSAVALELAKRIGGEIISVDSMQVYRGLDIGTAKPSVTEKQEVPHHLIDVVELEDSFDAVRFIDLARAAETEIYARHAVPIYCGGTGLYFKALFQGVSLAPTPDTELRAELEQKSLSELLAELQKSDSVTYEKIDRENARRVVRAVEAIRLSGRPFSEQQSEWNRESAPSVNLFALSRETANLRRRINARVDRMFSLGLISETKSLVKSGLEKNRTAMQAIGYRQVVEHLNGMRSIEETIELIKNKTWQLARRQMTWLRNQLQPNWISVSEESTVGDVSDEIAAAWVR